MDFSNSNAVSHLLSAAPAPLPHGSFVFLYPMDVYKPRAPIFFSSTFKYSVPNPFSRVHCSQARTSFSPIPCRLCNVDTPKSDRYGRGDVPAIVDGVRNSILQEGSGARPSTLQNPTIRSVSASFDEGDAGTAQATYNPLSHSSMASKHIRKWLYLYRLMYESNVGWDSGWNEFMSTSAISLISDRSPSRT